MRILVTGADGFIGKNLRATLGDMPGMEMLSCTRQTGADALAALVTGADAIIHLAGVNRPKDPADYVGNADFTAQLCRAVADTGRPIPVAFASSIQADLDNPYGRSKRRAEELLEECSARSGAPVAIFRLANVFGKWSQPEYNSAVATFCHNIARDIPVRINDSAAPLRLVYIDDVVAELLRFVTDPGSGIRFVNVSPEYATTVGELAAQIARFRNVRHSLVTARVGVGLVRALYATYVSFLPPSAFSYGVPKYGDARGDFVEMLKTEDSGQFSYFTAHPGVTRGGHYHHTKTEKFLVIRGRARYRFRHLITSETYEIDSCGTDPLIVETIPGWVHDITNIGDDELVVMLWANEIFDRSRPDTYQQPISEPGR